METKERKNIGWIDLLRVIACFLVVFSHCCDPFVAQFDTNPGAFFTGVFAGSLVRPCVPLFVMMTGVLLFPVGISMSDFYRKRIGRLLLPLLFWSVVLPLLFSLYLNGMVTTNSPSIVPENFVFTHAWTKLYTFIFNFTYDTTPLWYLYMLVGLYLVMPVLSTWLEQAKKGDIQLFLYIWGISLVLPYLKMIAPLLGYTGNYGNMGILGVCDWNDYGTFYYVSGFIGYLVLAYYLVKYPLSWSWKRTLRITIPMFLTGYFITSFGFVETQKYFPGNYANLEIIWYFAGINVFLMTFSLFVIIQKWNVSSFAWLSRLASFTFGIYLCHFIFVQVAYDVFEKISTLPVIVRILGMAGLAFGISAGVVWGLKSFKWTCRLVI